MKSVVETSKAGERTHVRFLTPVRFFNGLKDVEAGEVVRITKSIGNGAAWVVRDNGDTWAETGIDGKRAEYYSPEKISDEQRRTRDFLSRANVQITEERNQRGAQPAKRMGRNYVTPELLDAFSGLLAYVDQFGTHTNDNRVTRARAELARVEGK